MPMQIALACWLLALAAGLVLIVIACMTMDLLDKLSPLWFALISISLVLEFALLFFLNSYIGRVHRLAESPTQDEFVSTVRSSGNFWVFYLIASVAMFVVSTISLTGTLSRVLSVVPG
jgi:hypothetical protein